MALPRLGPESCSPNRRNQREKSSTVRNEAALFTVTSVPPVDGFWQSDWFRPDAECRSHSLHNVARLPSPSISVSLMVIPDLIRNCTRPVLRSHVSAKCSLRDLSPQFFRHTAPHYRTPRFSIA